MSKRLEVHHEYAQAKQAEVNHAEASYFGKDFRKHTTTFAAKIDHLSFCPSTPFDLIACSNTRAHVIGMNDFVQKKAFTRHNTPVTCATMRDDGQMVVTGTSAGFIQLCDVNSRSVLRQFHDHKTAIRVAKFIGDGSKLLSCSDDHTVKIFDIATETIIHELSCHTDSVRCGMQSALSQDIIVTGSYDHSVCFTDLRLPHGQQTVLRLNHNAPVTDLVMFPNSGTVAASGEQYINVYDMLTGPKQIAQFAMHQKAITGLAIDTLNSRLLSVGLDGFLRSYSMISSSVTGKIDYKEALLSVAMAPDARSLAVGAVSGKLFLDQRYSSTQLAKMDKKNKQASLHHLMTKRQQHFFGGLRYQAKEDIELSVQQEDRSKLAQFDARLNQFQHAAALDAAIATGSAAIICALVDELILRNALTNALQNRDDAALDPILRFILRYVSNPQYANTVVKLAHCVLDVYTSAVGSSSLIDEVLLKLKEKLDGEVATQQDCLQLLGELDLFLSNPL